MRTKRTNYGRGLMQGRHDMLQEMMAAPIGGEMRQGAEDILKELRQEIENMRQERTDDLRWKEPVRWWNAAISEVLHRIDQKIASLDKTTKDKGADISLSE